LWMEEFPSSLLEKQERFEGRDYTDEWITMMNQYCNIITLTTPAYPDFVSLDISVKNSQNDAPVTEALVSVSMGTEIVADSVAVDGNGFVSIQVFQNGIYTVVIEASGFITSEFEMTVACSSDSDSECVYNPKTAILSPELAPGETRIIMTWETNVPSDLDIHVISVRKSDSSICRTYYGNQGGCEQISLDNDNTSGGEAGAETVTLLDNSINQDYVYLIGVEDYGFVDGGIPFLSAGAQISITNGLSTVTTSMVASTISETSEFYFFGCLEVNSDGEFSFSAAPEGIFFEGNINPREAGSRVEIVSKKDQERFEGRDYTDEWITMMNEYCSLLL